MANKASKSSGPTRTEHDSFGSIEIPAQALYGAQTQRSLNFFSIGQDILPWGMVRALVEIKQACAVVNAKRALIGKDIADAIGLACQTLLAHDAEAQFRDDFPVRIWQTGSGTQSNMNANEVIANLANRFLSQSATNSDSASSGSASSNTPSEFVHPNDHVNRSQSSNDVFPTAMHLYALSLVEHRLLPSIATVDSALAKLQELHGDTIISGRTHLMDAMPLTLAQVFGAYRHQLAEVDTSLRSRLQASDASSLADLAIGGTAVGTGANAPSGFDADVCRLLSTRYGLALRPHPDKFAALSAQDGLLATAQDLARLASVLHKLANDIRLLASGPNTAFGELRLPANEPGSSIMPGKVNPTQSEALIMVCMQVSALVSAIEQAAGAGQLQLNTCRPMMIHNFSHAANLLADAQQSFASFCLSGVEVNKAVVQQHLDNNLMLVTYAAPELGYDNASKVARYAAASSCTIYEAADKLGIMAADELRDLIALRIKESLSV